jgi:hypothetical protein
VQVVTRYFKQAFVLSLAAYTLAGCAKPASSRRPTAESAQAQTVLSQSGGGGVMKNRSQIVATVLEVIPQETPGYCLRLRIDAAEAMSGYASFSKIGEEINAYPNFMRQEGRAIDYADERNKSLLQAGTLKAGDQISAEVYYRGGQGRESVWLLMSWQRKQ